MIGANVLSNFVVWLVSEWVLSYMMACLVLECSATIVYFKAQIDALSLS